MARITTECPQCGRVELGPDDLAVVVSPLEGSAWYVFDCRGCARQVFKPATSPVVTALSRLDVPVRLVPAEVLERPDPGDGPALGVDDLLDAMLWLRLHEGPGDALIEAETPSGC